VNKLPNSVKEIDTFFDKDEFVEKTRQQIEKDLSGLFHFRPSVQSDPLTTFTNELLLILEQLSPAELQQFCYRIDLSEHLLQALHQNSIDKSELAFQIIKREAQKVFLRTQFKS
jgi:hypothetical protein